MKVTLVFGREDCGKDLRVGATVQELTTTANLNFLGAPTENVRFTIGGDVVENDYVLDEGDVVYVESKPHSKA